MHSIDRSAVKVSSHGRSLAARPKPGFANKAMRSMWYAVWLLLYLPSPRPAHGWRCALLRLFGARVGKGAKPYRGARIWAPWNLTMKDDSVMGDGVDCYNVDRITLGRGAIVSQRAFLCTASHDFDDAKFPLVSAPVIIEAEAWVAAEAFIGPGVRVEEGAVVFARTVVTKDVAPWTVVAGNPARAIRRRKRRTSSI